MLIRQSAGTGSLWLLNESIVMYGDVFDESRALWIISKGIGE